ncbi:MAG: hypothetical protein IT379_24885 [Deltaproteobacteria bacterium]|nr:hypothetical protein [Deltaproteobacteria bacterium]
MGPEDEIAALELELERARADNAALADRFRASPTSELRDELKRAALRLHAIRDRLAELKPTDG